MLFRSAPLARQEDLPEDMRHAVARAEAQAGGAPLTHSVLLHDRKADPPQRMAVPVRLRPDDDDTRFALLGWRGRVQDDTLRTIATTLATASWFFRALERGRARRAMLTDTIRAIFHALDTRDPITGGHSERVAELSLRILERMDLDSEQREDIHLGALIHDIGKIGIPDAVLNKRDRLDDEEFATIRSHPALGRDIMRAVALPRAAMDTLYHHHERLDGSGYPGGLSGDAVCLGARIVAVADVFDALHSDRPYRRGLPLADVRTYLEERAGTEFDADIVRILLDITAP